MPKRASSTPEFLGKKKLFRKLMIFGTIKIERLVNKGYFLEKPGKKRGTNSEASVGMIPIFKVPETSPATRELVSPVFKS